MEFTDPGSIRVLLADIQPLTAAGISYFLTEEPGIVLVGEVKRQRDLAHLLELHKPSLLVADYTIPDFITTRDLGQVRHHSPETNILVISSDNDKQRILEVLRIGVGGYLTKSCSREEILMAVRSTARGERFFCHKILDILMEKSFGPVAEDCEPTVLTSRETEILKLLASGRSTQQIAGMLHLSPHTVHSHRKSIIRKLNIKSPTAFVIQAIALGILDPEAKPG